MAVIPEAVSLDQYTVVFGGLTWRRGEEWRKQPDNWCVGELKAFFLFVCFFYSPYKLKHYPESWWGRKPSCWFPGCFQRWVNCFFIYWSLWSWIGFKLFWLSSRTLSSFCPFSHLHLHIAQGSSLHSLPWKLIQEKKTLRLLVTVGNWAAWQVGSETSFPCSYTCETCFFWRRPVKKKKCLHLS